MPRLRRLLAGLSCAAAFTVAHAHAQPAPPPDAPETLETPYEDALPPAPPPASTEAPPSPKPAAAVPVAPPPSNAVSIVAVPLPDTRPFRPIRARRKLAFTWELGWNGLAGFGPELTYHVTPHFSTDLGAGISLLGWKVGGRVRYNFVTDPFTPFVGLGFNYGAGLGQFTTDPSDTTDPNRAPVTIDQGPSYLIQSVLGFDFIHRHGFTMIGTVGYAWLLNHDNYKVLAGTLKSDEKKGFDIAFRGGLVLGLAMGYAFE